MQIKINLPDYKDIHFSLLYIRDYLFSYDLSRINTLSIKTKDISTITGNCKYPKKQYKQTTPGNHKKPSVKSHNINCVIPLSILEYPLHVIRRLPPLYFKHTDLPEDIMSKQEHYLNSIPDSFINETVHTKDNLTSTGKESTEMKKFTIMEKHSSLSQLMNYTTTSAIPNKYQVEIQKFMQITLNNYTQKNTDYTNNSSMKTILKIIQKT